MRHLNERESAQALFHSLMSKHGQVSLLPVTFLPPKMMQRLSAYALEQGYDVVVESTDAKGETIRLAPREGVNCDQRGNKLDSG